MNKLLIAGMTAVSCGWLAGAAPAATAPADAARPAKELQARDGIARTIGKLARGERTVVAYIGGSITSAKECWRTKTTRWLQAQYPKAEIVEVNASMGGTGSDIGVYRYDNEVLSQKPDLVFIEFGVNDGELKPDVIRKSMEGMVRKTWKANPDTDIVFTYTITCTSTNLYARGVYNRPASVHEEIAEFYGIPTVCFGLRVAKLCAEGQIEMRGMDLEAELRKRGAKLAFPTQGECVGQPLPKSERPIFAMDGVHPTDGGHELYANILADAIVKMRACTKPADHAARLAAGPLHPECFEKAKTVWLTPEMLSGDWRRFDKAADPRMKTQFFAGILKSAPELTWCQTPGSKLRFRFHGTSCALYLLLGPDCGRIAIRVDGREVGQPLDLFDFYCAYYRLAKRAVWSGAEGTHDVEVELLEGEPDRKAIGRKWPGGEKRWTDAELAKPKYRGTTFFMAGVMLIGDIVK